MSVVAEALHCHFLGIDEGRAQLFRRDSDRPGPDWCISLAEYPLCRDLQRLDADRVLVGYDYGFFELELSSGRILRDCRRWKGISSAYRLPEERTLVAGVDLLGSGEIQILVLSPELELERALRRKGDYLRLVRPASRGGYLLCANDKILETNDRLSDRRELRAEGFLHAWMPRRFEDGSTLVSAGYGAFMARFDGEGGLCQRFGGRGEVPPEVQPFFYASFQIAGDGSIVVANWEGHGPDNGSKGRQLLSFSPEGEYRGSWSDSGNISSLQGLLLLE